MTRQVGVLISAIVAVIGSFVGSGAWVGTPVAEAADGALSATATLVAPSGPAFSIWTAIYIGFLAYAILQFFGGPRHDALRGPIALSMLLNAAWILSIQLGLLWLSVPIIAVLLVVLVRIFVSTQATPPESRLDALITDGTMGLYLGWVCVATIANATAWLVALGVTFGATAWAVAATAGAAVVGVGVAAYSRGAVAPAIGIVWGLMWIAQGRLAGDLLSAAVGWTAVAAALVVGVYTAVVRSPAPQRTMVSG
ncbi:TspO/MBR family protein [Rhodococcoides yunnanense]|uniref:TspO/MBR family protein n=1 Tax=Rhodococcoides yunnanense TaxID=278209 RepID=UPI0009341A6F|nr:TspO/MBR family protein [Rhodococcus yunnanensis]